MKLKDTVHRNLYKNLFILFLAFVCIYYSANVTNASFYEFFTNRNQIGIFLANFANPDWSFIPRVIPAMIQTLRMAVVGTVLGSVIAVPMSFFATTIVTRNVLLTSVVRFFMNIVRTIPNLLLAALFVSIFGIGEVTGIITLAVFTFGIIAKLMYDCLETIDLSPIEAAESVGATRLQIAIWSIAPQISHQIASYILFVFEINVRASTILGYVGAGGVGVILSSSLGLFRYDRVAVIIIMILVVIVVIDWISEYFRKKLL